MEALSILKDNATLNPVQQSVLNKRVSLPAKEIVTKQYAPDIKPVMKLITKQEMQQSQKNIIYIPPKVKNEQFLKYSKLFHIADFLGYQYVQQLDRMVYFRYNNEDYNEFIDPQSQKSTRYFGGLFIPLTALQSKHFKSENDIYSALNLSAPEIKDTVAQSFAKNSKGCSFDPMFSSNFSSGNMMAVIRKSPYQYDVILQNDTNCKASQWFNFAVKFIEEGTYKFNIVNLSNQNPLYNYGRKVPYYSFFQQSMKTQTLQTVKSGDGWSFGGNKITFSKTQLRKQNQRFDQTYYCLSFEYKCKNRQDIVIFSNSIPYTSIDYERFLNRALYNKIGQHMKMEKIEVCQTLAGTTLQAFLFYHRKSKSNTVLLKSISQQKLIDNQRSSLKHKTINLTNSNTNGSSTALNSSVIESVSTIKTIVILARHHPGETSASFIMEGVIESLMDNTQFDVFKKNFQFIIIPFVNPDGVKYGNQRVNLSGSDLAKSWKNPSQIFQPQVYHIKKLLKSINQLHPICLLINLSSTNQNLSSYFKSNSNKKFCEEIPELFPYLISKRVPQISFQKSQFFNCPRGSFPSTLSDIFPKSLVYDFTTSQYGWKDETLGLKRQSQSIEDSIKQTMINQFTPDIYRSMGKQLVSAYLEYARLCSRNIGIQDRWLKQIEDLSLRNNIENKQNVINQQLYEQYWEKDMIRLNFSAFNPPIIDSQRGEIKKPKTMIPYRFSSDKLQEVRSRSKKLTMPFLKNNMSIKEEKQNTTLQAQPMSSSVDQIENLRSNASMDSLFGQIKKSSVSSSIFTPKRKSEILKQISQSIKQSSYDKQVPILEQQNNKSSGNLLTILQKKQKKLPGLIRKKSQISFSDKIQIKDLEIRDKNKEAFMKFQSLKRSIPALGVKAQIKQSGRI